MKLTAEVISGFATVFLKDKFDRPVETPPFHHKGWTLYCSDEPQVALAAPRGHAKSTSFTHTFILANALFRIEDYIMILGASEEMAQEHLQDIANELKDNEALASQKEFRVRKFLVDQKTDIVVQLEDGYVFRIIARGAEQKIRGKKWRNKRLGMIVADDMEDDEQVESKERREKFMRWLLRAAKQALRDGGRIRVHGTVLHDDSALSKLMRNKTWKYLLFKAHAAFDDFSEILWPQKFSEERLRAIRQEFIESGDAAGYSQEFLNDPLDNDERHFRKQDFLDMQEGDRASDKIYIAAGDLAVSKGDKGDRTAFVVGGKDIHNIRHLIDIRKGRWASNEWVEEMFSIQQRWKPVMFALEGGAIAKAVMPMLYAEMQRRGVWMNVVLKPSTTDKKLRASPAQRAHKSGAWRFDKSLDEYAEFEHELLRFTGYARARDDQVDAFSLLNQAFEDLHDLDEDDFYPEPEEDREMRPELRGRSAITGY